MFKNSSTYTYNKDMGWTTIIDMQNKLVIHVAINVTKTEVDKEITDPDGVPLVWVEGKRVTRVRRMTEDEFVKYFKEFDMTSEIKLNGVMVYVNPDEIAQKQKDGKEAKL